MRVTKRDVLLIHCIVANVPISPQNYKMIWIIILLRRTTSLNLISPSSVNFVMQNFPAFMIYVNTETLNMDHKWDSERAKLMWRIQWEMLTIKAWEKNWNLANNLTDTEMENGRHRVFDFAMSSFDMSLLKDKLDYVFKELKCAAKVNLAFGFVLKNFELGMCGYFYAHESKTFMERSKLECTQADMTNLKDRMQKMGIVDICTRKRANTKWKFYKLTNLTIFASLLKDVPMVCKDTVLPEPLLRNPIVNCFSYEKNTLQPYNDNLSLFRAYALHLHGNKKLKEETSKIFNLFLNNKGKGIHQSSKVFIWTIFRKWKTCYNSLVVEVGAELVGGGWTTHMY